MSRATAAPWDPPAAGEAEAARGCRGRSSDTALASRSLSINTVLLTKIHFLFQHYRISFREISLTGWFHKVQECSLSVVVHCGMLACGKLVVDSRSC